MNEKEFFSLYIPALEQALLNDDTNDDFSVLGPDWFVKDKSKLEKIYSFEDENFEKYKSLFQNVAYYFGAKSHNFNTINGIKKEIFKNNLGVEILKLKKKYNIE